MNHNSSYARLLQKLIYVSAVDIKETSGQGSFENNFINYIKKTGNDTYFFTISKEIPEAKFQKNIPLNKDKPYQYITHQIILVYQLFKFLVSHLNDRKHFVMFIRESALILAPVLISKIFRIPTVIRSGPEHINLSHYDKTDSKLVIQLYKLANTWCQRSATKILVATQGIKRTLIRTYKVNPEKVKVIPNPVNDSLLESGNNDTEVKIDGISERDFVFGYIGAVYYRQCLHDIVNAAVILKEKGEIPENLKILIVGGGDYLDKIRTLVKKYNLEKVVITTGMVNQASVPAYFNYCDFCIATYSKEFDKIKGSSALKMAEYLFFNKYILAAGIKDYNYIEDMGFGQLYKIEDPESMANNILDIYRNRRTGNKNSREYILLERTGEIIFNRYLSEIYDAGKK